MHEPVADSIGQGGVTDSMVPLLYRALSGDDGGGGLVAVLNDLKQILPLGRQQWRDEEVVQNKDLHLGQPAQSLQVRPVAARLVEGLK